MTYFGISEKIWTQLLATCFNFKAVKRVILYGSRARGDDQQGSDIDIAIDAPQMPPRDFACLWNALDDIPIIYKLDVVHLQSLINNSLLSEIQRDGVSFFKTVD